MTRGFIYPGVRSIRIRTLQGQSATDAPTGATKWLADGSSSYTSPTSGITYQPLARTAQDILTIIADLQPDTLERFISGYPDPNFFVPVASGQPSMTATQFLQACIDNAGPGCIITPRVNLQDYGGASPGDIYTQSQNLYNFPLNPPMRYLSLDNWSGFQSSNGLTQAQVQTVFDTLYAQGWFGIAINDAGGYTSAYGNAPIAAINSSLLSTTVNVDSLSGQAVLSVANTGSFNNGDTIIINEAGGRQESHNVISHTGTTLTLDANLSFTHTALQGDPVRVTSRPVIPNNAQLTGVQGDSSIAKVILFVDFPGFMQNLIDIFSSGQAQSDPRAMVLQQLVNASASNNLNFFYPILQGFWDATMFTTTLGGPFGGVTLYTLLKNLLGPSTVITTRKEQGSTWIFVTGVVLDIGNYVATKTLVANTRLGAKTLKNVAFVKTATTSYLIASNGEIYYLY